MSVDFATTTYCAWCGVRFRRTYRNKTQQACGATHARKQTRARQQHAVAIFEKCPTAGKVPFAIRGAAIEAAYRRKMHFYLCRCGSYHLTSKPNDISIQAIGILQSKEKVS